MFQYVFAIIPAYLFLYLPLSSYISPTSISSTPNHHTSIKKPYVFNASFIAPDDEKSAEDGYGITCPEHGYTTHILSHEPLVIYIENFLSAAESSHLLEISAEDFSPSGTSTSGQWKINPKIRNSAVATPSRTNTVKCIEARARSLQGWRERLTLERLRLQRYETGGHYVHHYDWRGGADRNRNGGGAAGETAVVDRTSSFMVYVDVSDDLIGGGTEFPRLKGSRDERWCRFVECPFVRHGNGNSDEDVDEEEEESGEKGVAFKPIKGNAVFWENLRPDGKGYTETWHAGLPVEKGTKVGMNIWSWGEF